MLDTLAVADDAEALEAVREKLVFRLADMLLAIPVTYVREIFDQRPLIPLPSAPHHVLGMMDVRGQSIAVVDFAQKLGHGMLEAHEGSRIVVLELESHASAKPAAQIETIAILTDGVVSVAELEESGSQDVPNVGESWSADFITGLGRFDGEVVLELDLERVFGNGDQPNLFA